MSEWLPIETCKDEDSVHIRGVWVRVTSRQGVDLKWQQDAGYVDENGRFIGSHDDDFGWDADDYTHWMPLPEPPNE